MRKTANLKTLLILSIFIQTILFSTSVFADCELAKLLASDGAENDYFGNSVAISGDTAVIGAYSDNDNGNFSGSAYIFRYNGSSWTEEAKILASDGAAGEEFGISVAISDDIALIGAFLDDEKGTESGSAYIFRFNDPNWVQEAKLLASDGAKYDRFGTSVAISGDTAVIGAYGDDDKGSSSGSAYIFRFNGSSWVQEAKILASDGAMDDNFGYSVSISDGNTAVGALYDDDSGSAYIFRFNGSSWVQKAKLSASDSTANDYFGNSVSISGDTAVIGAYNDDDNGYGSGSAYIFRFNGLSWIEEDKLLASDGAEYDWFGISVAISDDTAVIGAYDDDDNGYGSGSAYIFRFNGSSWLQEDKLLASDGAEYDWFGISAAISGDSVAIGAYGDDDKGSDSGSAYIFGLSMNPGDIDLDNDVDFFDYSLFAPYWMEPDCGPCNCNRADFTRDGIVDANDLKVLADNWLAGI